VASKYLEVSFQSRSVSSRRKRRDLETQLSVLSSTKIDNRSVGFLLLLQQNPQVPYSVSFSHSLITQRLLTPCQHRVCEAKMASPSGTNLSASTLPTSTTAGTPTEGKISSSTTSNSAHPSRNVAVRACVACRQMKASHQFGKCCILRFKS
jgi:hypothetical protein